MHGDLEHEAALGALNLESVEDGGQLVALKGNIDDGCIPSSALLCDVDRSRRVRRDAPPMTCLT